jgi:hypothetical protein
LAPQQQLSSHHGFFVEASGQHTQGTGPDLPTFVLSCASVDMARKVTILQIRIELLYFSTLTLTRDRWSAVLDRHDIGRQLQLHCSAFCCTAVCCQPGATSLVDELTVNNLQPLLLALSCATAGKQQ